MSKHLAAVMGDLLSRKRAAALCKEMEKPAGERRDGAEVVNEVMEGSLFTTPKGAQLEPSNLRKVFNKLLTDANLRRVRFHELRHSFASLLLQNGESPAYVKEQMGHSSIKITVDIYGHLGRKPHGGGQTGRTGNRKNGPNSGHGLGKKQFGNKKWKQFDRRPDCRRVSY